MNETKDILALSVSWTHSLIAQMFPLIRKVHGISELHSRKISTVTYKWASLKIFEFQSQMTCDDDINPDVNTISPLSLFILYKMFFIYFLFLLPSFKSVFT